jgi:hypothetical protein
MMMQRGSAAEKPVLLMTKGGDTDSATSTSCQQKAAIHELGAGEAEAENDTCEDCCPCLACCCAGACCVNACASDGCLDCMVGTGTWGGLEALCTGACLVPCLAACCGACFTGQTN